MSGNHNANQKEVSMEPVATVSGSGVNWIQPQASRLKDRDCLYSAEQIAAKDAEIARLKSNALPMAYRLLELEQYISDLMAAERLEK